MVVSEVKGRPAAGDIHRRAVKISLGVLPSSFSLRMTGDLAGLVGSMVPAAGAAIAAAFGTATNRSVWRTASLVGDGPAERRRTTQTATMEGIGRKEELRWSPRGFWRENFREPGRAWNDNGKQSAGELGDPLGC